MRIVPKYMRFYEAKVSKFNKAQKSTTLSPSKRVYKVLHIKEGENEYFFALVIENKMNIHGENMG